MVARATARIGRDPAGDDLFARIGAFLAEQRLGPEPEHYGFAYHVLKDPDGALAQAVARITDDGVRLSRTDIESLGGSVRSGPDVPNRSGGAPAPEDERAEKLVGEAQAQVDGFADMMRRMHDETRDFGRDIAHQAAVMESAGPIVGIAELARVTGAMLARISEAEDRLECATRESDELRAKLAEARVTARRDPLTGLPNRRAFEEEFATRTGQKLCLALCDVDRFKRINDGFGHGVGDRVLASIADTLRVTCEAHLVARHGGEEFAVLVQGLSLERAAEMLEDARAGLSAKRFRSRETDRLIGRVTMSVGLTPVEPDEDLDTAFARADRYLYTAKSTGRDRLCMG